MTRKITFPLLALLGVACMPLSAENDLFEMPRVMPAQNALRQKMMVAVRSGNTLDMERISRQGVELLPHDPVWRYNLACALAYRRDKAEALRVLAEAIELGYRDVDAIKADQDMRSLLDTPAFEKLLVRAKELADTPAPGTPAAREELVAPGIPVEISPSNTLFDLDIGCFRTLLKFSVATTKSFLSESAARYHGPAADVMQAWMRAGEATGNIGDLYMNRDMGHSLLATTNFPGLTPLTFSQEAIKHNAHRGLPNMLFDYPLIGNASLSLTSGPMWRSLPRLALTDPYHSVMSAQMYMNNQTWVYPAHRDYVAGQEDHFPANVPYHIITLGSSFTDQPFMEGVAATLAAFPLETKRALTARKIIAPIIQLILRRTLKSVVKPEDYLTSLAHPVVFDGAQLDVSAMVEMAHSMGLSDIPPLVGLRLIRETQSKSGRDYFDPRPETLLQSSFAIARIARGVARTYSMEVDATVMPNNNSARTHWFVLQGNTDNIRITPRDARGTRVKLEVDYHGVYLPLRPDGSPSGVRSSRVDIGCVAEVDGSYSPPAIISICYLPDEARSYRADGKIQSIDYRNSERRYADPVLSIYKEWKDIYEYDNNGELIGWFRLRGDQNERFTHAGHRVLESDRQNRATKACGVQYLPREGGAQGLPPTLVRVDTEQIFHYTYLDDKDRIGRFQTRK